MLEFTYIILAIALLDTGIHRLSRVGAASLLGGGIDSGGNGLVRRCISTARL